MAPSTPSLDQGQALGQRRPSEQSLSASAAVRPVATTWACGRPSPIARRRRTTFTVELEGDADLRHVVLDAGLPAEVIPSLGVMAAYDLLRIEAERRVLLKLVDQEPAKAGEYRVRLDELSRRKAQVVEESAHR